MEFNELFKQFRAQSLREDDEAVKSTLSLPEFQSIEYLQSAMLDTSITNRELFYLLKMTPIRTLFTEHNYVITRLIIKAINAGDILRVMMIIAVYPNLSSFPDRYGNSLLSIAVGEKNEKFLDFLLMKGCDINGDGIQYNDEYQSLEHMPPMHGDGDVGGTSFLLPPGHILDQSRNARSYGYWHHHDFFGEQNSRNELLIDFPYEIRPLHRAVMMGDLHMIAKLIGAGANVNQPNTTHLTRDLHTEQQEMTTSNNHIAAFTPLMFAAYLGNTEVVRFLLLHGANVDLKLQDNGKVALTYAVQFKHIETIKCLLMHGARDAEDQIYQTSPTEVRAVFEEVTQHVKNKFNKILTEKPEVFSNKRKLLIPSWLRPVNKGCFYQAVCMHLDPPLPIDELRQQVAQFIAGNRHLYQRVIEQSKVINMSIEQYIASIPRGEGVDPIQMDVLMRLLQRSIILLDEKSMTAMTSESSQQSIYKPIFVYYDTESGQYIGFRIDPSCKKQDCVNYIQINSNPGPFLKLSDDVLKKVTSYLSIDDMHQSYPRNFFAALPSAEVVADNNASHASARL